MHTDKKRPKSFGMLLKQLRELKNLTQEQLAYEVGADVRLVELVEQNIKEIPPMMWSPWGDALRVPPSQLVAHYLICKAQKICIEGVLPYTFRMVVEENTLNEDSLAQAARLSWDPEERLWHGR